MRTVIIIVLGLVYALGIWTIKYLDDVLPEDLRNSVYHYPTLLIMWIFTPVILAFFIIDLMVTRFRR